MATNSQGQKVTQPANVVITTNSAGQKVSATKVGQTLLKTNGDIVEETTIFGVPDMITKDGSIIPTTSFEGVTVVTGDDGQPQTSFLETTPASTSVSASGTTGGSSSTGTSASPASSA